jgi:hypothetical protein
MSVRVVDEPGDLRFGLAKRRGLGHHIAQYVVVQFRDAPLRVGGLNVAVARVVSQSLDAAFGVDDGDAFVGCRIRNASRR